MEGLLKNNERVAIELLGRTYDGNGISENETTELKLKFISKYLNNRKYLNGVVDLKMFSDILIKNIFTKEEQEKISSRTFFVDNKDLKDEEIKRIFKNSDIRKRGIVINFKNKNYIFSLNDTSLE